jgi:hypothetical protein
MNRVIRRGGETELRIEGGHSVDFIGGNPGKSGYGIHSLLGKVAEAALDILENGNEVSSRITVPGDDIIDPGIGRSIGIHMNQGPYGFITSLKH